MTQTMPNSSGLPLFLRMLYGDIMGILDFLLDVHYYLQFLIHFVSHKWKVWSHCCDETLNPEPLNQHCTFHDYPINHDKKLCGEDIKTVMDKLGVLYYEQDGFHEIGEEEFSRLFEVEPSLEELKEAFDVFDINRDGFIDPSELQRVLCILGQKQGSTLERCRRMISGFDDNGDGLIDFDEFVIFMEKFFC